MVTFTFDIASSSLFSVVKQLKSTKSVQATKIQGFVVCCLRYRLKQRHSKNVYRPDYEVSLLRLIEKVTNGTVIELSLTGVFYIFLFGVDLTRLGTAILLKPGIISGGPVTHECPTSRSIGYFLEPIIMLAPFSKKLLALTLRGITTDDKDLSVRPLQTSR